MDFMHNLRVHTLDATQLLAIKVHCYDVQLKVNKNKAYKL